ncbi:MAG: carboxypeptidase M32 [Planctomycetota bacterium]
MPSPTYDRFIARVKEISTAETINALLEWDQETYMPPKAAATRAAQLALIAGLAHEKLIDPEFGRLLEAVEQEQDPDPVVATNVREMRRIYDRKVKLPTVLVQEIARTSTLAKSAWVQARAASDFERFAPHLDKLLDLKRQVADRIGYTTEPYDALMDEFEPGARVAEVQAVFDRVKAELVPLVQAFAAAPRQPDTSLLERPCPVDRQAAFGRRVVEAMGFDFEAGRIDTSAHPFCQSMSPHDVRFTTRYNERYLPMSLFGMMHEAGHGLYEQGLNAEHAGTPAGTSVSLGIHESQSRLWENLVGRSRAFWRAWFPQLQAEFPALAGAALEDWYFAINAVRPSFIRVEADEVTYGLHIMLRLDLERRMLNGQLAVAEAPAAWNEGMRQLLGITPPDDARGCLQDIHWSMGIFGYFPTYALGNLYGSQFFEAARAALPELDERIARGELRPLREWLRAQIHTHGQRYRAGELVARVSGRPLGPEPYLAYLRSKFRPLYGL